MQEYHKIQSVFHRNPATNMKTLLPGVWSLPEFEFLQDNEWVYTEKVDGTNIRVITHPANTNGPVFAGRTDNAAIPAPLVDRLRARFDPLASVLAEKFKDGATLYGATSSPSSDAVRCTRCAQSRK
jgi:hypothetical protein